jgi:hypothetical protein
VCFFPACPNNEFACTAEIADRPLELTLMIHHYLLTFVNVFDLHLLYFRVVEIPFFNNFQCHPESLQIDNSV